MKDDSDKASDKDYDRFCAAISGKSLPLAIVDLDALESNVRHFSEIARTHGREIRVATKSVRSLDLLDRIRDASEGKVTRAMAYSCAECTHLVSRGWRDVLVAYPTVAAESLREIARVNLERGVTCALAVDCEEHVVAVAAAAREMKSRVPLVVDCDMSFRAAGAHLGVRRSPLRTAEQVVTLAKKIASRDELSFHGILAYEAHVAGVSDKSLSVRAFKSIAKRRVLSHRAAIVEALRAADLDPKLVNGGGTGSAAENAKEAALTEITVGSGFLASHLFDDYRDLQLTPAAYFALEITRNPDPGIFTCHGGGWIASGAAGVDRLPRPVLPAGLSLLSLEGAGEVQTPIAVPESVKLHIGDPIFFRHAKAGELAEHVNEYLLVRGDEIRGSAKTYRGLGLTIVG